MASFCNQCAKDLDFEPGDYKGWTTLEDWKNSMACLALCEDCGTIQVDPEGNCVSPDCTKPGHNKPWPSDAPQS